MTNQNTRRIGLLHLGFTLRHGPPGAGPDVLPTHPYCNDSRPRSPCGCTLLPFPAAVASGSGQAAFDIGHDFSDRLVQQLARLLVLRPIDLDCEPDQCTGRVSPQQAIEEDRCLLSEITGGVGAAAFESVGVKRLAGVAPGGELSHLQGADGVVFVGDSQLSEAKANGDFWQGMRQHISENGLDPEVLPTVIQFNKRDLPDIRSDEELDAIQARSHEPLFKAVAIRGEGVLETLHGLLQLLFIDLNRKHDFERKFRISSQEFLHGVFGRANSNS